MLRGLGCCRSAKGEPKVRLIIALWPGWCGYAVRMIWLLQVGGNVHVAWCKMLTVFGNSVVHGEI